jgi:phosphoribosylamine--glycine ligase
VKVLVIGSGGREHALAWKLAQEAEVVCAPGNAGIGQDVETMPLDLKNLQAPVELASRLSPDLVVIGPEDPLVDGVADRLRAADYQVFGPNAAAAQLEGSKAFSKDLMRRAGIATARFSSFSDPAEARGWAISEYGQGSQLVVKASGNALGKGVTVAKDLDEVLATIDRMMIAREFGEAGSTIVLEERLIGREFSLLTLVGDRNFVSLPVAQDYKRVGDNDKGPNTGGMGAYSPCSWVTADMVAEAERTMVKPILDALGGTYRGTLFTGVIVTAEGPKCLEYNVRLGDPETQTVMRRLGSGFLDALLSAATGREIPPIEVLPNAVVTVVVASGGYPGKYVKGLPIQVGSLPEGAKLFWAGAASLDGELVTAGGRVVGASGAGSSVEEARTIAYEAARAIRFDGAFFRSDIAGQAE